MLSEIFFAKLIHRLKRLTHWGHKNCDRQIADRVYVYMPYVYLVSAICLILYQKVYTNIFFWPSYYNSSKMDKLCHTPQVEEHKNCDRQVTDRVYVEMP